MADVAVGGQQTLLDRIRGLIVVAEHAVTEGVEPMLVALDELIEGLDVAGLAATDQLSIVRRHGSTMDGRHTGSGHVPHLVLGRYYQLRDPFLRGQASRRKWAG